MGYEPKIENDCKKWTEVSSLKLSNLAMLYALFDNFVVGETDESITPEPLLRTSLE